MPHFTSLIVGAHFRPPAKQVLAHLPAGTELKLEEENDNQYDPEAIRVYVEPGAIPESQFGALEAELPEVGLTLEQLMSTGPLWLGFVPSSSGKPLAKAQLQEPDLIGNNTVRVLMRGGVLATLGFGADGSPRLHLKTMPANAIAEGEGVETNWGDSSQ